MSVHDPVITFALWFILAVALVQAIRYGLMLAGYRSPLAYWELAPKFWRYVLAVLFFAGVLIVRALT